MLLPTRKSRRAAATCVAATLLLWGCGQAVLMPALHAPSALPAPDVTNEPIKVHMRSGALYTLTGWSVADSGKTIKGTGVRYDVWRVAGTADSVTLATDSVALVETNSREATFTLGLQGIGVMAVLGTWVSMACLADPKSCFGSCPTFYVEGGDSARVQAEGFSSSVAKVLEARDVDALAPSASSARSFAIHMRNEAWETHMVRGVRILAVPKAPGARVFAAGDSLFYSATRLVAPDRCAASEGNCLRTVLAHDDVERSSRADSSDLAARETIDLSFASVPETAGLVITARNSLVTTFLFYQTLAYMGTQVGSAVASMERGTREQAESRFGMAQLLGGIDVQLRDETGAWRTVGTFGEAGPIASDTKIVPLPRVAPDSSGRVHVRLRMAKGSWRIDWVSLAEVGGAIVPTRIQPSVVERRGRLDPAALATLLDSTKHLVSLPGDDFKLVFSLPRPAKELELFLESEGFYYEWMRGDWLAEENFALAAESMMNPSEALRRLAPAYSAREMGMEKLFWASRFNRRSDDAKNR